MARPIHWDPLKHHAGTSRPVPNQNEALFGLAWSELVWFGLVWSGLVWFGWFV